MLSLNHIYLYYKDKVLLQDISLSVKSGESLVITGGSGSGKTLLANIMAGNLLPDSGTRQLDKGKHIAFVHQQHSFNPGVSTRSYYQQRYDSNYGLLYPSVEEYIRKNHTPVADEAISLLRQFSLDYILDRKLIQLSNGEGKRLQIILALVSNPDMLILDNPLVGIDRENRTFLLNMLQAFQNKGMTYVLVSTSGIEFPTGLNRIVSLADGKISASETPANFLKNVRPSEKQEYNWNLLDEYFFDDGKNTFDEAVGMHDVTIFFGDQKVLSNVHWKVNREERWLIRGGNGSGKSMLLSLINGDNPKAFGQQITLFDKVKGSGESIWELKEKIGYVSPEMHLHFLRRPEHIAELVKDNKTLEDHYMPTTTAAEVIASGFSEQLGSLGALTDLQKKIVVNWLRFLTLFERANTPFFRLPPGQQRLLLLARALVKNPPLLILDEPCQGLDDVQTEIFRDMVDHVCMRFKKTLLYVSHFDRDVPQCITHRVTLERGEIIENRLIEKQKS